MKIAEVTATRFQYRGNTVRDSEGHGHPGPEHTATNTMVTMTTDEGARGYAFGAMPSDVLESLVKPTLIGEDPFYRERIWQSLKERQRLNLGSLSDRIVATIDVALWDLVGRVLDQPVYRLLGGTRDTVPAYASTMCGDDIEGGLNSPEAYAAFALRCRDRGYPAFKLHTWQPPIAGAPDARRDIAACAAVREALGPEVPLMLDPFHFYSREEALFLARSLEKLDYYWMEEPMDEHSMSSYVWLSGQTTLPICGPETAEGKSQVRAEWIKAGACDILRAGVNDVGGITPLIKIAHLAEAFGMRLEIHGGGAANLQTLCAMSIPGEYYERGLLHPLVDHDVPKPWLLALEDPMDTDGEVHVSQKPGLGMEINFEFIEANAL